MHLGVKTFTRRFWKKPRVKVGSTHLCKHHLFDEFYFGTLTVEDVYLQPLSMMTDIDAYAEGGYNLDMYNFVLKEIAGKKLTTTLMTLNGEVSMVRVPYVVKFRFQISDMVDPNGGNIMLKEYHCAWMKHLRRVAVAVGILDDSYKPPKKTNPEPAEGTGEVASDP